MMSSLTQYWSTLMPRERLVVIGGAALITLTVIWLLLSSVLEQRQSLKTDIDSIAGENQWMVEQYELMSRLGTTCSRTQISQITPQDFITRQSQRNGLQLSALQALSSSRSRLQASAADGNAFLHFAQQLLCQGYGITQLQIERDEAGAYSAVMEVNHGS